MDRLVTAGQPKLLQSRKLWAEHTLKSRQLSQKTRKIPKSTKFEDALGELEAIVQSLESSEQSLESSLEQFERGVALSRFCQQSHQANLDADMSILVLPPLVRRVGVATDAATTHRDGRNTF